MKTVNATNMYHVLRQFSIPTFSFGTNAIRDSKVFVLKICLTYFAVKIKYFIFAKQTFKSIRNLELTLLT